jgi:hypothetical protein
MGESLLHLSHAKSDDDPFCPSPFKGEVRRGMVFGGHRDD